tara:strand:- start:661 stop:1998 length:1338 start_codon:yes stop_codon:yes gene_type:complete
MANVENSLPMSMRYTITGSDAIPSRTRLSRFDATSSEYASNSNNKILIPVQSDGFLDTTKSYLFLKVSSNHTSAGDHAVKFDGNVASVIDKIEIAVSGSSGKVETLDRYNLYHLYDQVWNSGVEDITYQQVVNGGSAPALEWVAQGAELQKNDGHNNKADHMVLALKLKSGFLSSYFNKALPQGLPQFTIEITLASGIQAFIAQNADVAVNTYKVSECRFYAPVYQILDENVMGAYTRQITSSPTMWVAQSYSTIINNVAAQSSKQTLQLNASYKSLNGMITLMRPSANMNDKVKNILTATNISGVVSYLYRIGGSQYPQDAVDIASVEATGVGLNLSRAYMEASKTLAPHGHIHAKNTAVSQTRFAAADAAGNAVGAGSMCINLTRFSDDRLVNLGLNTAGSSAPSIIEIDFGDTTPALQDATTFCLYDCVWILNPNGMVERSF